MKRAMTAGLFMLIITVLLGSTFISHAAKAKKSTKHPLTTKSKKISKPPVTKTKAGKTTLKSELVVEKLWLNRGYIAFRLKNKGPGSIAKKDHQQGKVKVSYKGFSRIIPFSKIDPKGKLRAPGGSLPYTTRYRLKSPQTVTVWILFNKKALKSGRNISLKRDLGEKKISRVQKSKEKAKRKYTLKTPAKGQKKSKARFQKDKVKAGKTNKGTLESVKALPKSKSFSAEKFQKRKTTEEPVPMSIDRGIHVTSPAAVDHFMPGDTIPVAFRLQEGIGGLIPITGISLHDGDGFNAALDPTAIPSPAREMRVDFPIPGDAPPGRQYTLMVMAIGDVWGISDEFKVGLMLADVPREMRAAESLRVVSPNGGENWGRRSAHHIEWQYSHGSPAGTRNFVVELFKNGSLDRTIRNTVTYNGADRTFRMPWFIDRDQDLDGEYKVKVRSTRGSAFDESDGIFHVREPHPSENNMLVDVSHIIHGTDVGNIRISVQCKKGACRSRTMNFRVVSASTGTSHELEPKTVPRQVVATDYIFNPDVIPLRPGESYYAVVLFGSCFGKSDRFTIGGGARYTRLRIVSPTDRDRWYWGRRVRIEWQDISPSLESRSFTLMNGRTTVATITPGPIQFNDRSNTYYTEWDVPAAPPSPGLSAHLYSVRIENTMSGAEDQSGSFSILRDGIAVTRPVSGGTYYRGNFLTARWDVIGDDFRRTPVYIYLVDASGFFHHRLSDAVPAGSRTRSLYLDPAVIPTGDYQIMICPRSRFSLSSSLAASGFFTVRNPTLRLTSPRGGRVVFRERDRVTISWRTVGSPPGTGVRGTIRLIDPDGASMHICGDVDLNRGSFRWTVGGWGCVDTISGNRSTVTPVLYGGPGHRIRIFRNDMPEVMDESIELVIRMR